MRTILLIFIAFFLTQSFAESTFIRIFTLPEKEIRESKATVYWAVSNQTDDTPLITASGYKINPNDLPNIVAISRDLRKEFSFGDTLVVTSPKELQGEWIIQDLMNKRFTNKVDFLVPKGTMGRYIIQYTHKPKQ